MPAPLLPFSIGVSVLLQNERGEVLLQRRADDGLWGVVGGGREKGETFLQAAHRELEEETGLECPSLSLLPLEDALVSGPAFIHAYPGGSRALVGCRVYGTLCADALAQASPDDSGETLALAWFALDDLPPLSGNINRANMNVLRRRVGLPPLPLLPVTAPLPGGVGLSPNLPNAPTVQVHLGPSGTVEGQMRPGESFEEAAQRVLQENGQARVPRLFPLRLWAGAMEAGVDEVIVTYRGVF